MYVCMYADGYITSDCDADANVLNPHHYTKTAEEAVAAVLSAGTDVREPTTPAHYAPVFCFKFTTTEEGLARATRSIHRTQLKSLDAF